MRQTLIAVVLCITPFFVSAQNISTSEIAALNGEGVGLVRPDQLNLSKNFLSSVEAEDLARAFPRFDPDAPPAVIDLLRFIAKAQFVPPVSSKTPSAYLLARLDHLERTGSIDALEALLRQIGTLSPELFTRWLAASIWLGLEVEPCEAISQVPGRKPLDAMIFCTSLNGNIDRAIALTEANQSLGGLSESQGNLFLYYLDPDIFEGLPIAAPAKGDGAVSFLMRFDLGLPAPTLPNSLGPELKTLNGFAPWRERIAAAESLAKAGAITGAQLLDLYNEGKVPASGKPWDRIEMAQNISAQGLPNAKLVEEAFVKFDQAGLGGAFAEAIAPKINASIAEMKIGKCILALAATDDAPNMSSLDAEPASPLRFILRDSDVATQQPNALDLFEAMSHLSSDTPDLRLLADDLAVLRALGMTGWAEVIAVQIYARETWCAA